MEAWIDRSKLSPSDSMDTMIKTSIYCTKARYVFKFLLLILLYGTFHNIIDNVQRKNEINQTIAVNSKMDGEVNISLKPISDSYFQESNQSVPSRQYPRGPSTLPSLLRGDVESISNFPKDAKIVVSFKRNRDRKCKRPRIFGRLSGKYLTMVNWDHDKYILSKKTEHDTNSSTWRNIITGYYQVPSPGHYFLEIIGILCNDLTYDGDLDSSCIEDPADHRLTNDSAFIDVTHAINDSNDVHAGYWRWSHKSEPDPLYTRQQCHPDPSRNALQLRSCRESETLERFEPYKFEWSGGNNFSLHEPKESNLTICMVGKSHAQALGVAFDYWIELKMWKNVKVEFIDIERPSHMTDRIAELVNSSGYSLSIVAMGQWSAAGATIRNNKIFWGVGTTRFPDYEKELNAGIQTWKKKA